jgi:hypothetical protein
MANCRVHAGRIGSIAALLLCVVGACTLGDPSVYDRGDLGEGGLLYPNGRPQSSSSSSGAPDDASAADADTDTDAGVECMDFVPPSTAWTWDPPDLHYHFDGVVAGDAGTANLSFGVVAETAAHVDLADHPSNNGCTQCVAFDIADGRHFFHRSGIADVLTTQDCGSISASIANLIVQEVTFDGTGNTVVTPGGACFRATGVVNVTSPGGCE